MKAQSQNTVRMLHPTITQPQDTKHKVCFSVYHVHKKLEVKGQAAIGFTFHARKRFRILFRSDCSSLMVDIGVDRVSFRIITKGQIDRVLCEIVRDNVQMDSFLDLDREQTYWLSIDKNNNLIRFGKGEMLAELCALEFDFSHLRDQGELEWIASLDSFSIAGNFSKQELRQIKPIYRRLPVTTSAPPIIVAQDQINLGLIDSNEATVVNNLSAECTQLYNNVAGRNLSLNTHDFSDFSDAINWSIVTKGALCHTRLKKKR